MPASRISTGGSRANLRPAIPPVIASASDPSRHHANLVERNRYLGQKTTAGVNEHPPLSPRRSTIWLIGPAPAAGAVDESSAQTARPELARSPDPATSPERRSLRGCCDGARPDRVSLRVRAGTRTGRDGQHRCATASSARLPRDDTSPPGTPPRRPRRVDQCGRWPRGRPGVTPEWHLLLGGSVSDGVSRDVVLSVGRAQLRDHVVHEASGGLRRMDLGQWVPGFFDHRASDLPSVLTVCNQHRLVALEQMDPPKPDATRSEQCCASGEFREYCRENRTPVVATRHRDRRGLHPSTVARLKGDVYRGRP